MKEKHLEAIANAIRDAPQYWKPFTDQNFSALVSEARSALQQIENSPHPSDLRLGTLVIMIWVGSDSGTPGLDLIDDLLEKISRVQGTADQPNQYFHYRIYNLVIAYGCGWSRNATEPRYQGWDGLWGRSLQRFGEALASKVETTARLLSEQSPLGGIVADPTPMSDRLCDWLFASHWEVSLDRGNAFTVKAHDRAGWVAGEFSGFDQREEYIWILPGVAAKFSGVASARHIVDGRDVVCTPSSLVYVSSEPSQLTVRPLAPGAGTARLEMKPDQVCRIVVDGKLVRYECSCENHGCRDEHHFGAWDPENEFLGEFFGRLVGDRVTGQPDEFAKTMLGAFLASEGVTCIEDRKRYRLVVRPAPGDVQGGRSYELLEEYV